MTLTKNDMATLLSHIEALYPGTVDALGDVHATEGPDGVECAVADVVALGEEDGHATAGWGAALRSALK